MTLYKKPCTDVLLDCQSVTLETEVTNESAQRLYQNQFGFIREELLVRYYLNWNDIYFGSNLLS